ncbi:hypothetical protein P43SY_000425 [Pythium insidiosum]|uniref:CSC1/OSCA1-like 7TM region domain-containing protein n=1 Tax=Pythium insidiosum TaxID=114742 RepID=A0AAD5LG67_PYTIN|nr:hypothetical protein P43SY_000425 [Pythium insidiosum]
MDGKDEQRDTVPEAATATASPAEHDESVHVPREATSQDSAAATDPQTKIQAPGPCDQPEQVLDAPSPSHPSAPEPGEPVDPVDDADVVVQIDIPAPAAPAAEASPSRGSRVAPKIDSSNYRALAENAAKLARQDRLGAGAKSVWQASMRDIGALGIGLQLYFMLTKYLSVAFLVMGILALPTIGLNLAGHGITSKLTDPLQLSYSSLGNQGVHEDIASDPNLCLPRGDIDCNWTTVSTRVTSDPVTVTWIITINDCVYSLFFLGFYVFFQLRARQAIDEYQLEKLTPAKYAVLVRGLPRDATEKEIHAHFNKLYDLTQDEEYFPLWFGCCWSRRRRKVRHSLSRHAVNRSVVSNVDHLEGIEGVDKALYLGSWIAEISIGHPTGGLLRTFLSMQSLTQSIAVTKTLKTLLEDEKMRSFSTFKARDERLIHASAKKLDKLEARLERKKATISSVKQAHNALQKAKRAEEKRRQLEREASTSPSTPRSAKARMQAHARLLRAAQDARKAALATRDAFAHDACECAFVVFNNLESRRRCLQDYRGSTSWLLRRFQPALLRFRGGACPLVVTPAPEPSNILWENLDVTDRERFYRRSLTNLVTLLLLLVSAGIISGAESAQQQFRAKMPPPGLCERSLPQVFYGNSSFRDVDWELAWRADRSCPAGAKGETQFFIAYTNGIAAASPTIQKPAPVADPAAPPRRCLEPCVSELTETMCSTLPCFDEALQDAGQPCETYLASHALYCLCTAKLKESMAAFGYVDGPKRLWDTMLPCRGFLKDYVAKNGFIVLAAAVVVVVNVLLNWILRAFATFERHSSESAKATAIALKLFLAQFLNTAVIVVLVNTALGLRHVPVLEELFKGSYRDFERDWYPTVGMGITTTMLINAVLPQLTLCLQMFVVAPLVRCLQRRKIRTQEEMDKLYAGPAFDISVRYPMVLNSLVVTMIFCGGSPVLLFIAAATAFGTYWFDKLSIIHLYSVKTAYDEELGELALLLLPWTLVLHLGFSMWMYGNPKLMKASMIDLPWVLRTIGLGHLVDKYGTADPDALYNAFLAEAAQVDVLGKYGFVVKVVRSNVMVMFLFLVGAVSTLLLWTLLVQLVVPLFQRLRRFCRTRASGIMQLPTTEPRDKRKKKKRDVVIPEFTDVFRKSVDAGFEPVEKLGFKLNERGELVREWTVTLTTSQRLLRRRGELMRTWEAMQAPVRSYAIEMNDKYKLVHREMVETFALLRKASVDLRNKVQPVLEPPAVQDGKLEREQAQAQPQVEAAVEAAILEGLVDTEPVSGAARPENSVDAVPSPSEVTGEAAQEANGKQEKQDDAAEGTADAPVERAEA